MESEIKDIVEQSLKKAQDHDKIGNVGKAYAYYTVVAELCAAKRAEIEEAFTDVLCEWCLQLESGNRFQDLVKCYKRSLDIYSNNSRMLNNFAAHLLRNNEPLKAIPYLKRALSINHNFLPAERNLQNAYSMAVARWHFTMLNDKQRNNAYAQAICKRILQGYDTVLDVGTGTGLLSFYAKDAGASKIYACECSEVMVNIAKKVFEHNNAKDIILIPKHSSSLRIPDDIPERLKLVITETFDAGLFGELVIPTLIDVHKNILSTNSTGMVIPMRATLYTAAVECEYIRYRSSVLIDKLETICELNFENILIVSDDEYYDTENLENVKINHITKPQELLQVNFNNLTELEEFGKDGVKAILRAKCRYDGVVDGLVTWFKLHLDEEIVIDTSEKNSCWQLAVFPVFIPTSCKEGDILSIKAEVCNGKLKCSYLSTKLKNNDYFKYAMPKEIIAFFNDYDYVKSLMEISKSYKGKEVQNILDTTPFPIFGLMQLKENNHAEVLYYVTDDLMVSYLVKQLMENNEIHGQAYAISNYTEIQHPLDLILSHHFDMKGELKDCSQNNYYDLYRYLLRPQGKIIPEKIILMGQLMFSEDLPKMVFVHDANVQWKIHSSVEINTHKNINEESTNLIDKYQKMNKRYKIAEYINEYKINQLFDLNSSLYTYEILSDIKALIEIEENKTTESIVNFGKIDINRTHILPNALICWYKIQLTPEHIHHTRKHDSFMNHIAIILEDELRNIILADKEIQFKIHQVNSLTSIKLMK